MLLNYINEITIYIMEDVAIHGSSGNDVYKVVPKDEEISKIKENKKITIHHVYSNRGVPRSPLNL